MAPMTGIEKWFATEIHLFRSVKAALDETGKPSNLGDILDPRRWSDGDVLRVIFMSVATMAIGITLLGLFPDSARILAYYWGSLGAAFVIFLGAVFGRFVGVLETDRPPQPHDSLKFLFYVFSVLLLGLLLLGFWLDMKPGPASNALGAVLIVTAGIVGTFVYRRAFRHSDRNLRQRSTDGN